MTTQEFNQEARQKLFEEISKRITLAYAVSTRNLGFARDYGKTAMIEAEAFSLDNVESNLDQVAEWMGYCVSALQHDITRINDLKKLVAEIKESEEK